LLPLDCAAVPGFLNKEQGPLRGPAGASSLATGSLATTRAVQFIAPLTPNPSQKKARWGGGLDVQRL